MTEIKNLNQIEFTMSWEIISVCLELIYQGGERELTAGSPDFRLQPAATPKLSSNKSEEI